MWLGKPVTPTSWTWLGLQVEQFARAEMARLFQSTIARSGMQSLQQPSTTHLLHMFRPAFSNKNEEAS